MMISQTQIAEKCRQLSRPEDVVNSLLWDLFEELGKARDNKLEPMTTERVRASNARALLRDLTGKLCQ